MLILRRMYATAPLRLFALLVVMVSIVALSGAFFSQYVLGLRPCTLCYWQRVPYAAMIVMAGFVCWQEYKNIHRYTRNALWLCVVAFAAGTLIAAYHAGVEWGFWEGFTACSSGGLEGLSVEELTEKIMHAPAVSCKEAAIRILGLSMAGWNALLSVGCCVSLAIGLKKTI